jgi:hypothetical protein
MAILVMTTDIDATGIEAVAVEACVAMQAAWAIALLVVYRVVVIHASIMTVPVGLRQEAFKAPLILAVPGDVIASVHKLNWPAAVRTALDLHLLDLIGSLHFPRFGYAWVRPILRTVLVQLMQVV